MLALNALLPGLALWIGLHFARPKLLSLSPDAPKLLPVAILALRLLAAFKALLSGFVRFLLTPLFFMDKNPECSIDEAPTEFPVWLVMFTFGFYPGLERYVLAVDSNAELDYLGCVFLLCRPIGQFLATEIELAMKDSNQYQRLWKTRIEQPLMPENMNAFTHVILLLWTVLFPSRHLYLLEVADIMASAVAIVPLFARVNFDAETAAAGVRLYFTLVYMRYAGGIHYVIALIMMAPTVLELKQKFVR